MAVIGSAAPGSALSGSTWAGGVAPGPGDSAIVTHAVTLSGAMTFGNSGAAPSYDLTVQSGGSFTILNGGTLTLRGSVLVVVGGFRVEGGGTFRWDASFSASPTTTAYEIAWDSENAGCRVELVGSSDALRATVTSVVTGGAAKGFFNGERGLNVYYLDAQWARFQNLNDLAFRTIGYNGRRFFLRDSIIEASCGRFGIGCNSETDVLIERAIVLGGDRFQLEAPTARGVGKQLIVHDSTFVPAFWTSAIDLQVRRTFFTEVFMSDTVQECLAWEDNFFQLLGENGGGGITMLEAKNNGVFGRTYAFHNSTTAFNPHWFGLRNNTTARTTTYRGWLFESASAASAEGDIFFANSQAGRTTCFEQCITLPNAGGLPGGCFVNKGHTGSNATVCHIRHNTLLCRGELSGLYFGESGGNAAGSVPELQNNLCWSPTPSSGSLAWREGGNTDSVGVGATWGHNAFWNITAVSSAEAPKLGYNGGSAGPMYSGTLSGLTTDLNSVNPGFVDATRNLVAFGRAVGGYTGTDAAVRAAVIAALRARPNAGDASYNAAVSITALLDWVTAGFVPTNVALQSASDALVDGWRGAVAGTISTPPSIGRRTSGSGAPLRALTRSRLAGV